MNVLVSTLVPCFSDSLASSRTKTKQKSRRRGTGLLDATLIEPSCRESDFSHENSLRSQRVSRGSLNDGGLLISKRVCKRRSSTFKSKGDGRSSRLTGGSAEVASTKQMLTFSSKSQAHRATRRIVSTSASATRVSNRKPMEKCHVEDEEAQFINERHGNQRNNHAGQDEDQQQEQWSTGPARIDHQIIERATIMSRGCKYRNLSAGVHTKARVRATEELLKRPPSRQRHAFPIHLIDTNAFDSPETTERCRRNSGSFSSARSRKSSTDPVSTLETLDRPPSRYSVKTKRNSSQIRMQDSDGPSRRGLIDKQALFATTQAHHDPKTDGFADVDESVPPPFRIEVTMEASDTTLDSFTDQRVAGFHARQIRQWPYSNQEQHELVRMAGRGSDGEVEDNRMLAGTHDNAQTQLQWFGKDDQINNAHSFETVITLASPRLTCETNGDVTIEDDLEDSGGPPYHDQKELSPLQKVVKEPQDECDKRFGSRRAATALKRATPASKISRTDDSELQWIRSSLNPCFVDSTLTVNFEDSMDPETAIEQTPLYSSDDLMMLAATEMTDLHLDDYSALADVSMAANLPLTTARSPLLRTSLGMDFLSLFAQH